MWACLAHYDQVSPLHGWNQILGCLPGPSAEDLFEVAMGLSSHQRDGVSEFSREASPAVALAHCPGPPSLPRRLRGQGLYWMPGNVASSHRAPLPFPPSLVYMNGHFLLGQGSINTSEIPFVLFSLEASTRTCWLQPATFTLGAFPLGFDWTLPLFSFCTFHLDKVIARAFPFEDLENIL